MTTQSPEYIFGFGLTERERLLKQSEMFEAEAHWLLNRLDVQPGWRAIDIGCGPLGILQLLSEQIGASGRAIGLDREPSMIALATTVTAERGLANVELVEGDASATGLPRDSFHLTHARTLLVHCPIPERVIDEMVSLARPGGWVAVQDVDCISWTCEPPHVAWDRLYAAVKTVFDQNGLDWFIGRRLPGMLRAAGLVDVRMEAHARLYRPEDFYQMQLLMFVDVMREQIIGRGILTNTELVDLGEALRRHLATPGTVVIRYLLCQAWGRKPT
jgi:SAM-dependent methyltransferase